MNVAGQSRAQTADKCGIVLLTSDRFARIQDPNEGKYWSKLKPKMKIAGKQSSLNAEPEPEQCVCPNGQHPMCLRWLLVH